MTRTRHGPDTPRSGCWCTDPAWRQGLEEKRMLPAVAFHVCVGLVHVVAGMAQLERKTVKLVKLGGEIVMRRLLAR